MDHQDTGTSHDRRAGAGGDIARTYSRLAFLYDAWTWFTERHSLRAAVSRASVRDGEDVLEVAVGTGVVFAELLERNPRGRTVGIDLSEEMLRRARRKAEAVGDRFELGVGDARSLGFPSASFDLVVSCNMLGLVAPGEIPAIMSEWARVLRPGGRLAVVTMIRPRAFVSDWVYRLGAEWLGGWREPDLEPSLRAARFERIEREVVTQLGIPSEVLIARTRRASPDEPSSPGF